MEKFDLKAVQREEGGANLGLDIAKALRPLKGCSWLLSVDHEVRFPSYSCFETTVSDPLQTITATLLVSKWSPLPLRLVMWLSICTLKIEVRVYVGDVQLHLNGQTKNLVNKRLKIFFRR